MRSRELVEVVARCVRALRDSPLEPLLAEALEIEHGRSPRAGGRGAPWSRQRRDRQVRAALEAGVRSGAGDTARQRAVERVVRAYAAEIRDRFDPRVHALAAFLGRRTFNWMSHAAAGDRVRPWRLPDRLGSRIAITGATAELRELAARATVLLVPTHQSHNDTLLFGYALDRLGLPGFAWAAGLNLFPNAWVGAALRRAGAFTVDRTRPGRLYRSVLEHYVARLLESGRHTLVFAGGGRSRSGAIESRVRLGLLRAGLRAQRALRRSGGGPAGVFAVPVTVSYHYVLEAPWLIDQHLVGLGVDVPARRTGPTFADALRGYWRFFGHEDGATIRIGAPHDLGDWLGDASATAAPDRAAVAALGQRIVDDFHANATVLGSQLVARALFERLRLHHPGSLARLLALPPAARGVAQAELVDAANRLRACVTEAAGRGALKLGNALEGEDWIDRGLARLRELHGSALLEVAADHVQVRDLPLLYYYRNRLSGFGLALPGAPAPPPARGEPDAGGFLP